MAKSVYDVLENRRGTNLQIGIGAVLPFGGKVVRSKAVLDVIAGTWLACGEWLAVLLDERKD